MIELPFAEQFKPGGRSMGMYKSRLLLSQAVVMILSHSTGRGFEDLGVVDGTLTPCPKAPNCVSSQSTDKSHYVEPLHYEVGLNEAKERLLAVLRSMGRISIIHAEGGYVRVEFASAFFRFVDDVEFYFDDAEKRIHVRSASRTGYYDFGVNRRSVERIRSLFLEPALVRQRKANAR